MCHQIVLAYEVSKVSHHVTTRPGIRKHHVCNPSKGFDEAVDTATWIHQFLKTRSDFPTLNAYRSNFNSTIALPRGQTCGFKIKDYYGIGVRHTKALI